MGENERRDIPRACGDFVGSGPRANARFSHGVVGVSASTHERAADRWERDWGTDRDRVFAEIMREKARERDRAEFRRSLAATAAVLAIAGLWTLIGCWVSG